MINGKTIIIDELIWNESEIGRHKSDIIKFLNKAVEIINKDCWDETLKTAIAHVQSAHGQMMFAENEIKTLKSRRQ